MKLYILTHGRFNRQTTYDYLPTKWQRKVTFVVQEREAALHRHRDTFVLPDNIRNLHQTRQYLLDNVHRGKVVEMDDDIVFSARRGDDPTKFRPMEDKDFDRMFAMMEHQLDHHPIVGIVAREGANRNTESFLYATRQMRIHAFASYYLQEKNYRWDMLRSPGPEDFCMLLQILTDGEMNCVLNSWCQNQGGSNTSGGVSEYRTLEVHADACEHLAELYPKFVKVVEKNTKGSWGGGTRTDVRIQWKKAYASSK